jgi:hypothetical protein
MRRVNKARNTKRAFRQITASSQCYGQYCLIILFKNDDALFQIFHRRNRSALVHLVIMYLPIAKTLWAGVRTVLGSVPTLKHVPLYCPQETAQRRAAHAYS